MKSRNMINMLLGSKVSVNDLIDSVSNKQNNSINYQGVSNSFWVITKPTEDSELVDILFKSDIPGMMLQAKGGLKSEDILYIVSDENQANLLASRLLRK